MTIHVVVGPPCSGKSTFVQHNAAPGIPRWDFDLVAATVAGKETDHDIPLPVRELVLAMRRGFMGYVLDAETEINDLWLIHAAPSPTTIQRLAAVGAQFHLIDPGIDECIARAQRDNRPAHTEETIRAWYASPPELPGEKGDRTVKTKHITVQVKADEGAGEGIMTAYASTFDVTDSYGDVVKKGAFLDSLAEWEESGNTIPLLYGHDTKDPFSNIGGVLEATEDDRGLLVKCQLDLDNAKAEQVYKLLKQKRINQMSFAYDVEEARWADVDGKEVYELHKLKLWEVSVVPIGANQDTEIIDVKSGTVSRSVIEKYLKSLPPNERKELLEQINTTPDAPPATGVSISEAPVKTLEARLMLLERTHHV